MLPCLYVILCCSSFSLHNLVQEILLDNFLPRHHGCRSKVLGDGRGAFHPTDLFSSSSSVIRDADSSDVVRGSIQMIGRLAFALDQSSHGIGEEVMRHPPFNRMTMRIAWNIA